MFKQLALITTLAILTLGSTTAGQPTTDPTEGGAPNDNCFSAHLIVDGVTPFSTIGATTDGPPHPACNFFGDPQISQDIWFDYFATTSGNVTVSLCGSDYDTELAVYVDCFCPVSDGNLLVCNDDFCALQSEVAFEAIAGQCYKIRVGGFQGATGSGTMSIVAGGCASSVNDCCSASLDGSAGCNDPACCAAVCALDPFCCDVQWDGICASQALQSCGGLCGGSCPPSGNDCCLAGVGPGCNDPVCCNSVCALDPFCCENTWDQICATEAVSDANCSCEFNCADVCPIGAFGEPNPPNGPCAAAQDDTLNGGCNVMPNAFLPINCGETVCGISGNNLGGQATRDLDWYSLALASPAIVNWSAMCEFNSALFIADEVCPANVIAAQGFAACAPATVSAGLPPGTYYLIVTTSDFVGQDCPLDYNATVTCAPIGAGPANDFCGDASVITDGTTSFSNANATTDGPGSCGSIGNDIWYDYFASCTGTLTISLCAGTTYDSVVVVYDGCACPAIAASEVVCDDDFCAVGGGSQVTFAVVQGQCYKVRIGGFLGATGSGNIQISCAPGPGEPTCVQWTGGAGTVFWGDFENWSGLQVPDNDGPGGPFSFCVQIAGSDAIVTQNIPDADISSLFMQDSTLNITGGDLTIQSIGGFDNNGFPTVGNGRAFRGEADFDITGSGTLRLNGATASVLSMAGNTITNTVTHTIAGFGIVNADMVNAGTIVGDVAGQTLMVCGANLVNTATGQIAATGGATVQIADSISGFGDLLIDGGTMQIFTDAVGGATSVTADCIIDLPGIQASTLEITGPTTTVSANMLSVTGGTVSVSVNAAMNVSGTALICPPPGGTASVAINNSTLTAGTISICPGGMLTVASGVTVQSEFRFENTVESEWSWAPGATLTMTGVTATLEVGGFDYGIQPASHTGTAQGYGDPPFQQNSNFDMSVLIVASGAHVDLADAINNGNRNGPFGSAEALYVDTLIIEGNGVLDLNNLHLYYKTLVGNPGQIVNQPTAAPPANIVSANPSLGFMDVLQNRTALLAPQGIGVGGTPNEGPVTFAPFQVTFTAPPSPAPAVGNVFVDCTDTACVPAGNCSSACPNVILVNNAAFCPGSTVNICTYSILLNAPPPPRECITFTFTGTNAGQKLQYRVLPANVDLTGSSNTQDMLHLIQAIQNGTANQPANLARYNVNRQDTVNTQDLLRLIQLLNGTQTTQAFNGATATSCP